jgi:uncharacterized Fe-S center protein
MTQCAHGAIMLGENGKAAIDHALCHGCAAAAAFARRARSSPLEDDSCDALNKKISEYAFAVVNGRPHFHVSLIVDVSPYCDCHSENDTPVIPMWASLASFDPVALDMACADLCNQQKPLPGSALTKEDQGRYF